MTHRRTLARTGRGGPSRPASVGSARPQGLPLQPDNIETIPRIRSLEAGARGLGDACWVAYKEGVTFFPGATAHGAYAWASAIP